MMIVEIVILVISDEKSLSFMERLPFPYKLQFILEITAMLF
jgi:hypothetical protein